MQGLEKGIENGADDVFNAVKNIGSKAVSALKGVLKIFSPSQVFADLGQNIGAGLVQGIQGTTSSVTNATSQLGTAAIVGGTNAMSSPSAVSNVNNTTNNVGGGTQNVTVNLYNPSVSAVQQVFASINQDSLNTSRGLTPVQGAY